ncbi:MAG: acyltransferase [Spirochaetia bacterium]|nr:acyltransferase [Spirochaetia bacterium]
MKVLEYYFHLRKKTIPYWAKYSLFLGIWKIIRKILNVTIIPNIPITSIRIFLYRIVGYNIGKNVFIGMKCYLDDIDPKFITIENNVTISYGTYFSVHGRGQGHTKIHIKNNAYIGMRCNIISGKKGITIGENSIIGAVALVNSNIPKNCVAVGIPARVIKKI